MILDLKKHLEEKEKKRLKRQLKRKSWMKRLLAPAVIIGALSLTVKLVWDYAMRQALIRERRAIVHLDFENSTLSFNGSVGDGPAYYGGGIFRLVNEGKGAASLVIESTDLQIASDAVPGQDLSRWLRENYVDDVISSSVISPQTELRIPRRAMMSAGTIRGVGLNSIIRSK